MKKVIQGTYADFKIIKSRKVAQIIVEVPLEAAQSAITMFGVPNPSIEQWVAVAALQAVSVDNSDQPRRSAVSSAAMLCQSDKFAQFLIEEMGLGEITIGDRDSVADGLRSILGIQSRAELQNNDEALTAFNNLKGEYDAWLMDQ